MLFFKDLDEKKKNTWAHNDITYAPGIQGMENQSRQEIKISHIEIGFPKLWENVSEKTMLFDMGYIYH